METLPLVGLAVLFLAGGDVSLMERGVNFIVPFFDENLVPMVAMGGVFAALRVAGAVGLLRNREWGYVFSVITCTVTLALMVFMLPAGVADGVLSGTALLLLVVARHGRRPLV